MATSLVAVDYARPVQKLFEQPSQIGVIHGVFRRAVNIALNDTMLTLLSDGVPRMPNGVRLQSGMIEELGRRMRPSMEVWVGGGSLVITGCDFSLRLPGGQPWEPRPKVERFCWDHETVAGHVRLIVGYVAGQQVPTRYGIVRWERFWELLEESWEGRSSGEMALERMALPRLQVLARASWRQDVAGVEEATRGLAGLGPGLTPAGDDVLAGFAAVMVLLSERLSVDGVPRGYVGEVIARVARSRTTMLSGVLLEYAARGEVAEQVGDLLLALALRASEGETVLHAVDGLLAFGATSGGDTLLGVLLGLRTLEGESALRAWGAG